MSVGKLKYDGVFKTQSNIFEGNRCENSQEPIAINYFRMQPSSFMFDMVLGTSLSNIVSFNNV